MLSIAHMLQGLMPLDISPKGYRRFYMHAICFNGSWGGTVTGYAGSSSVMSYSWIRSPYSSSYNAGNYVSFANCTTYSGNLWNCGNWPATDPQQFQASFIGQLDQTTHPDAWTINDQKRLLNCSPGTY